jgi:predicted metal-binding membrane protein
MDVATTSRWLGGLLFPAAGLYQFTPLKRSCLKACRSPFDLVVNHWHDGTVGALPLEWRMDSTAWDAAGC